MSKGGIFHYVKHSDAPQWEALGWVKAADLGQPHCNYSSLYKWVGTGPVKLPYLDAERDAQLRDLDELFGVGGDGE